MTTQKTVTVEELRQHEDKVRAAITGALSADGTFEALSSFSAIRDTAAQVPGLRAALGAGVEALQARVADLEQARDDWKARAETLDTAGFKVARERDALRAQVGVARRMAEETARAGTFSWGRILLDAMDKAVLSTPPVETTPAPERDPRFQCAVHTNCFGDSEYCTKRK